MEEENTQSVSILQRYVSSSSFPAMMIAFGAFIAMAESLLILVQGESIENAVWPQAVRTLSWTFVLRENVALITILSALFLGFCVYSSIQQHRGRRLSKPIQGLFFSLIGAVMASWIIFVLMDYRYIRGAFLLLPTIYGIILLGTTLAVRGPPGLPDSSQNWKEKGATVLHVITVFLAAWLVMPGIPALIGIAPSPPLAPSLGYGAEAGPFDRTTLRYAYDLPEEVIAIQGPTEEDIEFSIYLTLPHLPEEPGIEGVPLAILFHAFNNPSIDSYSDWIDHLAAKGMVVAYIQYPTDVRPEGGDDFEAVIVDGTSDWPHHVPRMLSIESALQQLNEIISAAPRDAAIDDVLGELVIMPEHLWIGGHSLGGAYSLQALGMVQPMEWGSETLLVDTEMAAARPVQEAWLPDYTNLPENSIVHLVVSEDDMTVGQCNSVHQHALFDQIDDNQSLLLYIPSDRYGFPRLVATHYIPANEAHDTLADWAFYRRVDAQADWVVAHSRGDLNTADFAYANLINTGMLTNMGKWSDGVDVLPIQAYTHPSEAKLFAECFS
ncbi:MAG: hypothetical protein CMB25_01645 [Euryarchaeota archaeon]|nr:hypothetical protein [Euryarchaeota archaeon]|tara:strand:- start:5356 stop:7008 length:1653 start_codon:yes stop_codon:yes gene_type:complete